MLVKNNGMLVKNNGVLVKNKGVKKNTTMNECHD